MAAPRRAAMLFGRALRFQPMLTDDYWLSGKSEYQMQENDSGKSPDLHKCVKSSPDNSSDYYLLAFTVL